MLTIVFDLDGTLIDTAPDLIDTLNVILAREGLPAVAYDDARAMIGGGARAMIERALKAERRDEAKAELDRMFRAFVEHYAAHIADRSRPFPHLEATLDGLAGAGHRLAVCTNKLEWLSRRLLDRLNLSPRFSAICGADTFGVSKPDPAILRQTVARAGAELKSAIMVGDAGPDVGVARRAGVPVICVSFGYTEVPVADLKPDVVIDHMRELRGAIEGLTR